MVTYLNNIIFMPPTDALFTCKNLLLTRTEVDTYLFLAATSTPIFQMYPRMLKGSLAGQGGSILLQI